MNEINEKLTKKKCHKKIVKNSTEKYKLSAFFTRIQKLNDDQRFH